MKQLFEAKPHFSRAATQPGLQWNRGTSLSTPVPKAPLAVGWCHLHHLYIPRRSILRSRQSPFLPVLSACSFFSMSASSGLFASQKVTAV